MENYCIAQILENQGDTETQLLNYRRLERVMKEGDKIPVNDLVLFLKQTTSAMKKS